MSIYLGNTLIAGSQPNAANKDLSNLSTVGQEILDNKLNKQMITNCITEIPQDIKLELNNGTLTLKAGSKVYFPNGFESDGTTKKFDEVVVETDIIAGSRGGTGKLLCSIRKESLAIDSTFTGSCSSGSSLTPTVTSLQYDTGENVIYRYMSNIANYYQSSFPIAIISVEDGAYKSIDQVFNGFGYIGSTIFALPGVKGLIPNGRNEDGSLKNIEFAFNNVFLDTEANGTDLRWIRYDIDEGFTGMAIENWSYNEDTNLWQHKTAGNKYCINLVQIQRQSVTGQSIKSFRQKNIFHAIDHNDFNTPNIVKSYISGTNWYRIWSDGWIEQGGRHQANGSHTITLLKPFTTNNYTVTANLYRSSTWSGQIVSCYTYATSSSVATISVDRYPDGMGTTSNYVSWYACGY